MNKSRSTLKEYQVVFTDQKLKERNSFFDADFWEKGNILTDFCSPWNEDPFSKIEFTALHDAENFYFRFIVFDAEICLDKKDNSVESIGNSDRVELFFRTDENINPYYCVEMDTAARIMDFKAYPNKDFNFEWNWPKNEIEVQSQKKETSFEVAGRISIQSLKDLKLLQNNSIEAGIYRAKFSLVENLQYEPTWISWVNPNTETPNFHIASSFGKLTFMQ